MQPPPGCPRPTHTNTSTTVPIPNHTHNTRYTRWRRGWRRGLLKYEGDALVQTSATGGALEFGPPQVRVTYSLKGQMLHAIFQPSLSPHHPCSLLRALAPSSLFFAALSETRNLVPRNADGPSNRRASAARSASSRAVAEVKVNGRARGERDGGRCGLDGWARLSATWAMPWPLE